MDAPLATLMIDIYRRPRPHAALRVAAVLLRNGQSRSIVLIRFMQYFHARGWHRAAGFLAQRLRREFGCYVAPSAVIGPGLRLPHPQGIVIGSAVRIGANCIIYHQVTLGGVRRGAFGTDAYPVVGDGVILFAGAKVLGPITIGDAVQVGANAVVLRDVPPHHHAVGIPARHAPLGGAAAPAAHGPVACDRLVPEARDRAPHA